MSVFTRVARGRLAAWLTVAAAIVVGAAVFGTPQPDNPAPVSATGLSVQWQSTQVQRLQDQLPSRDVQPAIVVISRGDGGALSETDRASVGARADDLRRFAVGGQVSPAQVSPDGAVALVAVPLDTAGGQEVVTDTVTQLRATLADLPGGLTAEVTGAPAFTADLSSVFDGADVTLLVVTAAVVALLLLITYRSPFLWIVPLVVVAATEQLTLRAVDVIVPGVGINLQQGQVTGIASVLVFGAATDYALLLIARYREELRRHDRPWDAMKTAWRGAAPAIIASGGTVIFSLLCLLLCSLNSKRALGQVAAIGIAATLLVMFTSLPSLRVLGGRWAFWHGRLGASQAATLAGHGMSRR
ncbi:MMPL family transporter, partial [Micromonospora saelicesensis]|uniref:MMPL family transporter n=1 Tax=Micromonospora saelicesensis TaxID=285676 RepID=UPI0011BEBCBB